MNSISSPINLKKWNINQMSLEQKNLILMPIKDLFNQIIPMMTYGRLLETIQARLEMKLKIWSILIYYN